VAGSGEEHTIMGSQLASYVRVDTAAGTRIACQSVIGIEIGGLEIQHDRNKELHAEHHQRPATTMPCLRQSGLALARASRRACRWPQP
jgi:hypothetical protein